MNDDIKTKNNKHNHNSKSNDTHQDPTNNSKSNNYKSNDTLQDPKNNTKSNNTPQDPTKNSNQSQNEGNSQEDTSTKNKEFDFSNIKKVYYKVKNNTLSVINYSVEKVNCMLGYIIESIYPNFLLDELYS